MQLVELFLYRNKNVTGILKPCFNMAWYNVQAVFDEEACFHQDISTYGFMFSAELVSLAMIKKTLKLSQDRAHDC